MSENDKTNDKPKEENKEEKKFELKDEPPIETSHQLTIGGQTLSYTVNTGMMPLKNKKDEIQAEMFFMAYALDRAGDVAERPLIFIFNGGPGSSSVWLHMGTCGPKRVKMEDEGWMPKPPFSLEPNEHTWLDIADLVFIDPVGTGYSIPAKEDEKKYFSMDGDLDSIAEFIRLFLTRFERWSSPLFLAGESYGTFRAAGLAGRLLPMGIALNGIILVSTVLNMQALRFGRGNDLPNYLYVPTYTATAWYHGKLPEDLQKKPLREVLDEVEAWAEDVYSVALMKGDRMSDEQQDEIATALARYTGLNEKYIKQTKLRVNIFRFCKELLRDEGRTVGRLDSRFKGRDADSAGEMFEHDPSMSDIMPPYTSTFNQYVRAELGYKSDRIYEILSRDTFMAWEYPRGVYADTSEALRSAMAKNPHMQVLVARGYYDLATPHFAAEYTFNHMDIDNEVRDNIHYADYDAGHMFYLEVNSLGKLKADVAGLIEKAVGD